MLVPLLSVLLVAVNAYAANDLWNWFGGRDIDYFTEGKKVKDPLRPEIKFQKNERHVSKGRLPIRDYDKLPFDWADYEDPSSPVFFDEGGDYIPPRPYQILAANPTRENAAKLKRWQQKKAETTAMMQKLLLHDEEEERRLASVKWRDVGVYYFYSSTCSVCREEAPVLKEMEALGVQITPIQIDYESQPALYPKSLNYDIHFQKSFEINVTPTFVVFGNNTSRRWEGYTSSTLFKSQIANLFSPRL